MITVFSLLRNHSASYRTIWLHSVFIALIALTPFLFLMQINERVHTSRSWDTLWFLSAIFGLALAVLGILSYYRADALRAIGYLIDQDLRTKVFDAVHRSGANDAFRGYADIAAFRNGTTGSFATSLLDATFAPLFIAILFLLHPAFGWLGVGFIFVIAFLSYRSRKIWKDVKATSKKLEDRAFAFGLATASKHEIVRVLNLLPGVRRVWAGMQDEVAEVQLDGQGRAGVYDAILLTLERSKIVLVVGLGAVLFLLDEITAATSFAAFIVMLRGLGPVIAVARNWSTLQEVQDAAARIVELLETYPPVEKAKLPPLVGTITCDQVGLVAPGGQPILAGIKFNLPAGSILGVIGPSGAGKSSLLRLLVGAQQPSQGSVKIDGFPVEQWPQDQLGPSLGYLPQAIDLLPGTILENVSRFQPASDTTSEQAIEALRMAGALDMVQSRGRGLDYQLGVDGSPLSGGQKQRLGLARALFGDPKLVILDEPNAALDAESEQALAKALTRIRTNGGTIVFSTHKAGLLGICDYILVVLDGYMHSFATRDEMFAQFQLSGNTLVEIPDSRGDDRREAS